MSRIIYSRGFPYGAPMVTLRGAGTKTAKEYLKSKKFQWVPSAFGWVSYYNRPELKQILLELQNMGYEVVPKEKMDEGYVIDLEPVLEDGGW